MPVVTPMCISYGWNRWQSKIVWPYQARWSYPDDIGDDSLYVLDVSPHLVDGVIQTNV